MPSKSGKQKRFMAVAAHDKGFAKRAGISQKVAKEFNRADKRVSGLERGRGESDTTLRRLREETD